MFESWTGRRSIYLSVTYNTHLPNSHIGFCTSFFLVCVVCAFACMCLSLSSARFASPFTFSMGKALRKYNHFFFPFFSLSLARFFFAQLLTFSMTSGHFQNVYALLFNSNYITMSPNRMRMQCSHVSLFHLDTRLQFQIQNCVYLINHV